MSAADSLLACWQVLELIRPENRLVLFLQQSNVEWASSLWLPVIQQVDPQLKRSVIVVSKLDNRMRSPEVLHYLCRMGCLSICRVLSRCLLEFRIKLSSSNVVAHLLRTLLRVSHSVLILC